MISVGQVCDKGNIITFRSTGGTILNDLTGSRIEFDRSGGVYRLKADASTKTKTGTNGVNILMCFEQDKLVAAEAQFAKPGTVLVLPSGAEVEQHELTHLPFRNWCRHCVHAKGKESPHLDASPGSVSKFLCLRKLEDNLTRRNEFANPDTNTAISSESKTDAAKRARHEELEPPQKSSNNGGAPSSSAGADVEMRVIHAGKRPLEPDGDADMVCGLDVCDELEGTYFAETYGNDCEGDYTDETTGYTSEKTRLKHVWKI